MFSSTNVAKLILASAGHMIASLISLDPEFAVWALLHF